MGLKDFFNKEKYSIRGIYNGVVVFRKNEPVRGQLSIYQISKKLAYLIPPELQPIREGDRHRIDYNLHDSCPLEDIKDIAPELVEDLEKQIVGAYRECIDQTLNLTKNDPEKLLQERPLTQKEIESLTKAKNWLQRYELNVTGSFYNLWRWGLLKKQQWFISMRYVPTPESLVFPKKITRVGLRPGYLFEREHATIVQDAIRRKEPEWAWIKEIIPWLCLLLLGVLIFLAITSKH